MLGDARVVWLSAQSADAIVLGGLSWRFALGIAAISAIAAVLSVGIIL
jgi:hypothetical protein